MNKSLVPLNRLDSFSSLQVVSEVGYEHITATIAAITITIAINIIINRNQEAATKNC